MKKIGLTGGIGSGKTKVAELFCQLGVPVFNSDLIAKDLQDTNADLKKSMLEIFPDEKENEIYIDGKLNRKKIASIVFADKNKLEKLNAIVHPAVEKAFLEFCKKNDSSKYVLKEAAILFEIGANKNLDGMIVITAPEEIRIQRVMERDGATKENVLERMKNQWSEEDKIKKADFIIVNDGKELILPQVVALHEKLST